MKTPRLLVTGEYLDPEFTSLLDVPGAAVTCMPWQMIGERLHAPTFDVDADAVLVASTGRNGFPPEDIQRLRRCSEPSPVVAVLGSWCEGEERSGQPWPGVPRVFWHQARYRLTRFIDDILAGRFSCWQLPPTASRVDRAMFSSQTSADRKSRFGSELVGVCGANANSDGMLHDAITSVGARAFSISLANPCEDMAQLVDAIVIDADVLNAETLRRVSSIREHFGDIPIVALLNCPRYQDIAQAQELGIEHVLAKPFELADFQIALAGHPPSGLSKLN